MTTRGRVLARMTSPFSPTSPGDLDSFDFNQMDGGEYNRARTHTMQRRPSTLMSYHEIAQKLFSGPATGFEDFMTASENGDVVKIMSMLADSTVQIDVDAKDKTTGNTALITAAKSGKGQAVATLLRHNADVTLRNHALETAVNVAPDDIKSQLLETVERDQITAEDFMKAAWVGDFRAVNKYLSRQQFTDVNCKNKEGYSPLLLVTRDLQMFEDSMNLGKKYKPAEVVALLLRSKAEVNVHDLDGYTPLHYASAAKGKVARKIVTMLCKDHAQIDARNSFQNTPLHGASITGYASIVITLLENGADANSRGFNGTTPMHIVAYNGHDDAAMCLLRYGADITIPDSNGKTALDVARGPKMITFLKGIAATGFANFMFDRSLDGMRDDAALQARFDKMMAQKIRLLDDSNPNLADKDGSGKELAVYQGGNVGLDNSSAKIPAMESFLTMFNPTRRSRSKVELLIALAQQQAQNAQQQVHNAALQKLRDEELTKQQQAAAIDAIYTQTSVKTSPFMPANLNVAPYGTPMKPGEIPTATGNGRDPSYGAPSLQPQPQGQQFQVAMPSFGGGGGGGGAVGGDGQRSQMQMQQPQSMEDGQGGYYDEQGGDKGVALPKLNGGARHSSARGDGEHPGSATVHKTTSQGGRGVLPRVNGAGDGQSAGANPFPQVAGSSARRAAQGSAPNHSARVRELSLSGTGGGSASSHSSEQGIDPNHVTMSISRVSLDYFAGGLAPAPKGRGQSLALPSTKPGARRIQNIRPFGMDSIPSGSVPPGNPHQGMNGGYGGMNGMVGGMSGAPSRNGGAPNGSGGAYIAQQAQKPKSSYVDFQKRNNPRALPPPQQMQQQQTPDPSMFYDNGMEGEPLFDPNAPTIDIIDVDAPGLPPIKRQRSIALNIGQAMASAQSVMSPVTQIVQSPLIPPIGAGSYQQPPTPSTYPQSQPAYASQPAQQSQPQYNDSAVPKLSHDGEGELRRTHDKTHMGENGAPVSDDRFNFLSTSQEQSDIQWKKGYLLGRGAFGKVFCGLNKQTGELIAVKQIFLGGGQGNNKKDLKSQTAVYEREITLLKRLHHQNIVAYLGTRIDGNSLYIFMEFVSGGSIASMLSQFGAFEEEVIRHYLKQILDGVAYLHDNEVIHRDIKGANILVDTSGIIKLIDFGAAKQLCQHISHSNLKSLEGTPYWMAPEVVTESGYGRKSDIWSIGCVLYEMGTGSPPWAHMGPVSAIFQIGSGTEIPRLGDQFSAAAHDFLGLCLKRNPNERPFARELLYHSYVRDARHPRQRGMTGPPM
eukprot:Opistho-2@30957